ncbi:MAG TPA: hypothetical protein VN495_02110 [Candidatus Paceibacterota bacterium]|nr:hypothetical protein [Candidatus Paceibacterota bacterium]
MEIEVIDTPRGRRFLWVDYDHNRRALECTTERLIAPGCAVYEQLNVTRQGEVIHSGFIEWVHNDCPCFTRLGSLGDFRHELMAAEFEPGDKLEIVLIKGQKPALFWGRLLWSSMQLLNYGPQTRLYERSS